MDKKIGIQFIRKYIAMYSSDLVVIHFEETEDMFKIWVGRKLMTGVCEVCGSSIIGRGSSTYNYVIEDIPIYGKRVNLILCDRLMLHHCKCGQIREPLVVFDACLRKSTTFRYLDYIRIMGGENPFGGSVFDLFCNLDNLRDFKYSEKDLITELKSCGNKFYRIDRIMYDLMRVANYFIRNYKDNSGAINYEIGSTWIKTFARKLVEGDDAIKDIFTRRHDRNMESESYTGEVYRLVVKGLSDAEILKVAQGDRKYAVVYAEIYHSRGLYYIYQQAQNYAMDENGCYILPKPSIVKNGYDTYMDEVDNFELNDQYGLGIMDSTDISIMESLKKFGYDYISFSIHGGVRCVTLDDNFFSGMKDVNTSKYKAYIKNIDIEDRKYSFKVLPSLVSIVVDNGWETQKKVNRLEGVRVLGSGDNKHYVWRISPVKYSEPGVPEDMEYGFTDDNINNHTFSIDMVKAWVNSVGYKIEYVSHEVVDGKLSVYVNYFGDESQCIKCGGSKLQSRKLRHVINAGELNGYPVEIIVMNHKIFKCCDDGIIFERKYPIDLAGF